MLEASPGWDRRIVGLPYTQQEGNASDLGFYAGAVDDHGNLPSLGTWVGMNEAEILSISETPDDSDYFRIKSQNLPDEGSLIIRMIRNPYGTPVRGWLDPFLDIVFKDGTTLTVESPRRFGGDQIEQLGTWDLRGYTNVEYYAFKVLPRKWSSEWADFGARFLSVSNSAYLDQNTNLLTDEEIAQLEIESRVNDFDLAQSLAFQSNNFSYTDQYGAIGSHNPEEFFTRLFSNKYEQDPSPVQIARGLVLLSEQTINLSGDPLPDGTVPQTSTIQQAAFSQSEFLSGFALDNTVISVGANNYTSNLAIPNVPWICLLLQKLPWSTGH